MKNELSNQFYMHIGIAHPTTIRTELKIEIFLDFQSNKLTMYPPRKVVNKKFFVYYKLEKYVIAITIDEKKKDWNRIKNRIFL